MQRIGRVALSIAISLLFVPGLLGQVPWIGQLNYGFEAFTINATDDASKGGGPAIFRHSGSAAPSLGMFAPPNAGLTGQFWYFGQGNPTDARLSYISNNSNSETVVVDNNPTVDLLTGFPEEVGLDLAAGLYFAIVNGGSTNGSNAFLVRGSISGGAVTTVANYTNGVGINDDTIVNALHVDPINRRIYVGLQEPTGGVPTLSGIRVYSYTAAGVVTDLGFLTTVATSGKPLESGFSILDVRDFALDTSTNNLFFAELLTGGVSANGLFRLNIGTPNTIVQVVSQAQFPDNGSAGYIQDVEVDRSNGKLYFNTESQHPFPDPTYNANLNAIWWVAETATGGTATQVTLTGLPAGGHFYPGNMVLDQSTRQLYVGNEEIALGNVASDDVIYVFQLDAAGTSAALVNTITPSPAFTVDPANIGGMTFNTMPALAALNLTPTHPVEQGAAVTILGAAPGITDDGRLVSSTVKVSGSFVGSGDTLSVSGATTGTVPGTSISLAVTTDGSGNKTLTLSGDDTIAHYQTALAGVQFQATGDNPTNYGNNATRTITWQVNDGAVGNPAGTVDGSLTNIRTNAITIDAVNDPPVNNGIAAKTGNEDAFIPVTGVTMTDVDTDASQTITTVLSVVNGTLTLRTDVASGLVAGDVTGNGTNNVSVTATQNKINATLGNATGLQYKGVQDYFGPDTLHIVTSDNGHTPGPAQTDTDDLPITVNGINEVPSFTKGADQTVLEDAGAQTLNGWATAISTGPPNESAQVLNFIVTNNNNPLFSVQPAVSAAGVLTYTPAANANGTAIVTISIHDDGGTANGGVDTSATQTFNISVTTVNDVPVFTKGADQSLLINAPAQTVVGWATAISAGAANESAQALNFIVTNNNNSLFSAQPAVAANGTLTYTPAAGQSGNATVSVSLHDNGGILNGGVDTSAVQTFTIRVSAGEMVYVTNGSSISKFSNAALGTVTTVPITGMQAAETLVGIDLRPSTGVLYGVGSTSRIYTIDPTTGVAVQVGAAGAFTLNGTAFGTDFNPVADRIRQVSNAEQNLRLNPNDGTLTGTDTFLSPAGNVVATAYDRNDNDPFTGTTLFGIDSAAGTLVMIGSVNGTPNSPNGGLVTTVGSLGLGTNLNEAIGFDISGPTGIAYATITTGGISRLYLINLTTGAATNLGTIGAGTTPFLGVTVATAPTAGEVAISGRILTAEGRGITNATVTVSGGSLSAPITAVTGRAGAYTLAGLTAGETYVVTVASRRFAFDEPARVVTLNDNLTGLDFIGGAIR